MPKYIVEGGAPLSGRIRPAGNKNAALPIICATLLSEEPITLENVPDIRMSDAPGAPGAAGLRRGMERVGPVRIHARDIRISEVDRRLSARIRASILLAGPMLARAGSMILPPPAAT
jgi:UDP-N-acetylglucosamine 1-carboxyvinyltransferase